MRRPSFSYGSLRYHGGNTMASRNFSTKRSRRPHILRSNGVAAEVADLRRDVEEAFEGVENEIDGGSASKRFTSFGVAVDLVAQAPTGVTSAPSRVLVEHEVDDVFSYTDEGGSAIPFTFKTDDITAFEISPTQINTTTTAIAVVVFWND